MPDTLSNLRKRKEIIFFTTLSIVALYLTFNVHSKIQRFSYRCEIFGDKAGYYVYLPSFFIYNFDPRVFPDSIDSKTGKGFKLNYENNKVETKYTNGVAFLQTPFFLGAHIFAKISTYEDDGFSVPYHKAINIAAVFYLILGLFSLRRFLLNYFTSRLTYIIVFIIFFGTNLYHYSIDETGHSHVYSFFLFAIFLWSIKKIIKPNFSFLEFVFFCSSYSLIVLIRPINCIIFIAFFFLDTDSINEIKSRVLLILKPVYLLSLIAIFLIIISPQIAYWYHWQGKLFYYSYKGETFSNLLSPKFLQIWFSPLTNGFFLITPLMLISVFGIILMIRKKIQNAWFIAGLFMLISYLLASWGTPSFGCSFGQRSYVEYYTLLSIPFGYVLKLTSVKRNLHKIILISVLTIFTLYNIKMSFTMGNCWFSTFDIWDFNEYFHELLEF